MATVFTPTPSDLATAVARLDDRERLMLIDWLADQLPDHLADELVPGLAVAFERAEEEFPSGPIYPAGAIKPAAWSNWRAIRDTYLARKGAI